MCCAVRIRRSSSRPVEGLVRAVAVVVCLAVLPGVARATAEADRHWTYIASLIDRAQDPGIVLAELEKYAVEFPDDARTPDVLRRIARTHRDGGEDVLALDALMRVLRDHPRASDAAPAALELADMLAADGRWDEAADTYRWLLREHPRAPEVPRAQLQFARVQASRGRNDEARRALSRLIAGRAEAPVASRALFELAVSDAARGDRARARARFESVHERFPSTEAGAEGLLRAADMLREDGATSAATERYERLLEQYGDRRVRARALVALAAMHEADDPERAFEAYARAVDTADASEEALRGVARTGLRCGRSDAVRDAARAYAATFSGEAGATHVRLYAALAAHADGDDVDDELEALGRSLDADVAYAALAALALTADDERRPTRALTRWRDAERRAPDADRRAEALLAQARLALELERATFAAELALTAHDVATDPSQRAQALLQSTRAYVLSGDREHALGAGRRILAEHPLTPEAAQAREEIRVIERQSMLDPREAARRLAALAEHEIEDWARRSFEVALIHRDRLGDVERALALLRRAIAQAGHPEQRGRLELEFGRTLQIDAFRRGLAGDARGATSSWHAAKDALVDASLRAGTERSAQHARVLLVSMDLAERVHPHAPWTFDGWTMPLLGAVGDAEHVDPLAAALDTVRVQLRAAWRAADTKDERAWIRWRQAEISRTSIEARVGIAREALDIGPTGELEWSIRNTLGQLLIAAGDVERGARELYRVLEGDARGEVASSARFALGEARARQERYDDARAAFDQYATVHAESARGQYALLRAGDAAFYAGQIDAAAFRYRRLLDGSPTSVYVDDALYRLGRLLEHVGRRDAARDPLERLVARTPRSSYHGPALALLGSIAASEGDFASAIAHYAAWIDVDALGAAREDAWATVTEWSLRANDPDGALLWLDRRLRHREPDPRSLALRVRAAAALTDVHGAHRALRRLEGGFPDAKASLATARLDLAEAHHGLNELERAVELAQHARDEAPHDDLRARAAYVEGLAQARMGYGPEATDAWRDAAHLDPRGRWAAEALLRDADWSLRHGDLEQARQDYATFAARFPSDARAVMALRGEARCLRLQGRHADALDRHQLVLERFPESEGADATLVEIAQCHVALGQHETALATFRRVIPFLEADAATDARVDMAVALEALGRFEEAAAVHVQVAEAHGAGTRKAGEASMRAARALLAGGLVDDARAMLARIANEHGDRSNVGRAALDALERTREGTPARR